MTIDDAIRELTELRGLYGNDWSFSHTTPPISRHSRTKFPATFIDCLRTF